MYNYTKNLHKNGGIFKYTIFMNKRHALSQIMHMIYRRHLQLKYVFYYGKDKFLVTDLYVTGDNNDMGL